MMRWSLRKVLLSMVVGNLLLGVALFGLRSPTRAAPEEMGPPPELPAQVQQLRARIQEGRRGEPYSLSLSDEELTAMVGYFLASGRDVPFARVRVAVFDGKVVMDGVTKGLAVTLPVRVTGTAGTSDGTPWARVDDVSLGDTQVPPFVRDQIVRQANASLDLSRYRLPVAVDTLELRSGTMVLRGSIK